MAVAFLPALPWLGEAFVAACYTIGAALAALTAGAIVGSKMKQWALDHPGELADDLKRNDPREETPFTHPHLFTTVNLPGCKTKAHKKTKMGSKFANGGSFPAAPVGSIWCEDWLHCSEFEVYFKSFPGNKNRIVFIDGRPNLVKMAKEGIGL